MKEEAPVSVGASPIGISGGRSIVRAVDPRLLTLIMVVMPVVITVVPVRIRVPVPSRRPVPGGIAVRLTIPVHIAVKSPSATGHLDNLRHCWGAGSRGGKTGVRGNRCGAQNHRAEQSQNCCTHRSRPSTPLPHGPGDSPGAGEERLYALCIGVMSRDGLLGISGIEQVSCVSSVRQLHADWGNALCDASCDPSPVF